MFFIVIFRCNSVKTRFIFPSVTRTIPEVISQVHARCMLGVGLGHPRPSWWGAFQNSFIFKGVCRVSNRAIPEVTSQVYAWCILGVCWVHPRLCWWGVCHWSFISKGVCKVYAGCLLVPSQRLSVKCMQGVCWVSAGSIPGLVDGCLP